MRILIVDDEPALRKMVRLTLDESHEVFEAEDGARALEAVRNGGPFDVVLLDQKMPGLTGVEVLPEIRLLAPDTRVVMLTAHASLDLASAAMARGASHFLAKPMTPSLLRAAVAAAGRRGIEATSGPAAGAEHAMTLNGFVLGAGARAHLERDGGATHVFTVSQVLAGWTKDVAVRIAPSAFAQSGRPDIAPASRLAGLVARRLLADRLWREGLLPDGDSMRVEHVAQEQVAAALREDA